MSTTIPYPNRDQLRKIAAAIKAADWPETVPSHQGRAAWDAIAPLVRDLALEEAARAVCGVFRPLDSLADTLLDRAVKRIRALKTVP